MHDLLLVGVTGNTHVASSFERAAFELGVASRTIDTIDAYRGPLVLRRLAWWAMGKRPLGLGEFSDNLVTQAREYQPRAILVVGQAPVTASALSSLKAAGIFCANYATDDPWNISHRAQWYLSSLIEYDAIFTPRRSNISDFRALGCRVIHQLRFAYDPQLLGIARAPDSLASTQSLQSTPEVLFVGGADADRGDFFRRFVRGGSNLTLVGGYWKRHAPPMTATFGPLHSEEVNRMTSEASVNICLVRRANRDGHVMRSFEIPAVGGFMLAEDTEDHREMFGSEGECVLYFRTAEDAAEKARWALDHPEDRRRMARAGRQRILAGPNRYTDRLESIMELVPK